MNNSFYMIGSVAAMLLAFQDEKNIWWAAIKGFFSWLYVGWHEGGFWGLVLAFFVCLTVSTVSIARDA